MEDRKKKTDIYHLAGEGMAALLCVLSFCAVLGGLFSGYLNHAWTEWLRTLPFGFSVGFGLIGGALFLWWRGRARTGGKVALIAGLFGWALLVGVALAGVDPFGYLTGRVIEIPESHLLSVGFSALALVIVGMGLWTAGQRFNPINYVGNTGALLFGQGVILGFGLLGLPSFEPLPPELLIGNTASTLAILLTGGNLLLLATHLARFRPGVIPRWLCIWAGVMVLVIGVCHWETLLALENRQFVQMIRQTGEMIKAELIDQLEARRRHLLHLSDQLEFRYTAAPRLKEPQSLFIAHPELFDSLFWVDKRGRTYLLFPAGERAAGLPTTPVEKVRKPADRMASVGWMSISNHAPNQSAMCRIFVPVYRKQRLIGYVRGLFPPGRLFRNIPNFLMQNYSVSIRGAEDEIYLQYFTRNEPARTQTVKFEYLGYPFQIQLWPRPHLQQPIQSRFAGIMLLVAVLFGLCTTLMTWFAQNARYRAKRIAAAQQEEARMLKLLKASQKKMLKRSRQLEQINKEMAREIKQRWQVEQRLWENERRLQSILDTAAEGIVTIKGDGSIESLNRRAEEIFRICAADVIGKPLSKLILFPGQSESGKGIIPEWPELLKRLLNQTHEMVALREDRIRIPVEISLSEVELEKGILFTAIIRDITERKQKEEQLRTYARMLERHNRELQEFATIASHDLQEPLRKIRTFSDRLQQKFAGSLEHSGQEYLLRIQNTAKRMQELIDAWLQFSHVSIQARPFSTVDLHRVTQEVISEFQTEIEAIQGRVEIAGLSSIEADPQQMRQLMRNLVHNAMKFHKQGQQPMIKINGRILNTGNRPENATSRRGRFMEITVSDNGIGFDEKYSRKIFSVFQRLHSPGEYHGTGIGLSICQKIVERHGGYIRVKSKPGQGSQFVVTLPVWQSDQEEEAGEISGKRFE